MTHVLITQTEGNEQLTHLIETNNGTATRLPLIKIQPIQIGQMRQSCIHEADTWIFLSQHSVNTNHQMLKQHRSDQTIIAIGPGTQRALDSHELTTDHIPTSTFSTDGILELDILSSHLSRNIIIFSEKTAPQRLRQSLKARGHQVSHIATYQQAPIDTSILADTLRPYLENTITCVTTHSYNGLLHLIKTIHDESLQQMHNIPLLVTSQPMLTVAQKNGFLDIIQSPCNTPTNILHAIENHRTRNFS